MFREERRTQNHNTEEGIGEAPINLATQSITEP